MFIFCFLIEYNLITDLHNCVCSILALNAVEAAALKRAKEERKKLFDVHKSPAKRQGDIYEGPIRDSVHRVSEILCISSLHINKISALH